MFVLFFSLYLSMFTGTWHMWQISDLPTLCGNAFDAIGTFITSIFTESTTFDTLGTTLMTTLGYNGNALLNVVALILSLITSIGIVVMAVKGIKKVFGIFFMGIR